MPARKREMAPRYTKLKWKKKNSGEEKKNNSQKDELTSTVINQGDDNGNQSSIALSVCYYFFDLKRKIKRRVCYPGTQAGSQSIIIRAVVCVGSEMPFCNHSS